MQDEEGMDGTEDARLVNRPLAHGSAFSSSHESPGPKSHAAHGRASFVRTGLQKHREAGPSQRRGP